MAQNFFELSKATQTDILIGAQNTLGFEPSILEKDLWICAVLHELFSLPIPMAFKGGTSLSKGYGLIDRFSEDIDVTIDYRFFLPDLDLSQQTSRSALKKISGRLKERLVQYIKDIVVPHLQESLGHKYRDKTFQLELSDDGENLRVHYPPLFEQQENYLQHNVLLEFGGRNSIAPGEICEIIPYLATASEALYLPPAKVNVLSPLRTFWEKATLIHVECHRGRLESSPERLSRHWYDLAKLLNSWVGEKAINSIGLLEDVILHKKAFFDASYANYDDCLRKKFRLIPNADDIKGLRVDYKNMQQAGMFIDDAVQFEQIIHDLKGLEKQLNGYQRPV